MTPMPAARLADLPADCELTGKRVPPSSGRCAARVEDQVRAFHHRVAAT